jgi:hypothetical protein
MTITEATHALASLPKQKASQAREAVGAPMRLVDAISRVEPTWVEAVAVVQAVCAQLGPGQAAPPLDTIMISSSGTVSFPPAGASEDQSAVTAVGRLLSAVLRSGDCPMPVWESMELARRSPQSAGTAAAFGQSLTCFPAPQGPGELAKYYQAARRVVRPSARAATAPFSIAGLTLRAGLVVLLVTMGGVGTGMAMGLLVASRAPRPSPTAPGGDSARTVAHLPPFVS